VARIQNLPQKAGIWHVYQPGVWVFIVAMACMGVTLRRLTPLAPGQWGTNTLGVIDLAVGLALLIGAARYRRALSVVDE
jgi:hypothetical protein